MSDSHSTSFVVKRRASESSTSDICNISGVSKMLRMPGRVQIFKEFKHQHNVLYIMQRDQRLFENHSVQLGYELSNALKTQFYIGVKFEFLKLNCRQQTMAIEGFKELQETCKTFNVHFKRLANISDFIKEKQIDCIITDYSPLRESIRVLQYLEILCGKNTALYVCDSHNIVPCVLLTEYKRTCAAVRRLLNPYFNDYCVPYPELTKHKFNNPNEVSEIANSNLWPESEVKNKYSGGYVSGMQQLETFLETRLKDYKALRNKPDEDKLSRLSPWLHLGQISPLKVVLMAQKKKHDENLDSFINEVFTWRELSDHFCMHEDNYDNIQGALAWAQDTLETHAAEKRLYTYTFQQLCKAETHDTVWNAGQKQMILTGKMHGYIRMYWAKSLLKWTESPEIAIDYAIKLNDMFSLDGNDPNGYLGVMWSICGSMDQGFMERPVIGKIRPMSQPKTPKYTSKWADAYIDPKLLKTLMSWNHQGCIEEQLRQEKKQETKKQEIKKEE